MYEIQVNVICDNENCGVLIDRKIVNTPAKHPGDYPRNNIPTPAPSIFRRVADRIADILAGFDWTPPCSSAIMNGQHLCMICKTEVLNQSKMSGDFVDEQNFKVR